MNTGFKIFLLSKEELFAKVLAEQLELLTEFAPVIIGEEKPTTWFDAFLLDGTMGDESILSFIQNLDTKDAAKPMVFFTGGEGSALSIKSFIEDSKFDLRTVMHKPLKMSIFITVIQGLIKQYANSEECKFALGEQVFYPGLRQILNPKDGSIIRLTEKEADIINYLLRSGGAAVERGVLLEAVWGYNPEVTTHTLETHIYRLRQKIGDAAQTILTDDSGYRLICDSNPFA